MDASDESYTLAKKIIEEYDPLKEPPELLLDIVHINSSEYLLIIKGETPTKFFNIISKDNVIIRIQENIPEVFKQIYNEEYQPRKMEHIFAWMKAIVMGLDENFNNKKSYDFHILDVDFYPCLSLALEFAKDDFTRYIPDKPFPKINSSNKSIKIKSCYIFIYFLK